mmetsp:Transcript_37725/g.61141  ORF Transcript_37725/g.61141 Transcript_37725/m.61141 type:complete len:168 (-) Transcript_37725:2103-2606(-)
MNGKGFLTGAWPIIPSPQTNHITLPFWYSVQTQNAASPNLMKWCWKRRSQRVAWEQQALVRPLKARVVDGGRVMVRVSRTIRQTVWVSLLLTRCDWGFVWIGHSFSIHTKVCVRRSCYLSPKCACACASECDLEGSSVGLVSWRKMVRGRWMLDLEVEPPSLLLSSE